MDSYQMGLINLEKDLGDIDAEAFNVWQMNMGGIFWVFGAWLGWADFQKLLDELKG